LDRLPPRDQRLAGHVVLRSGVRRQVEDGQFCQAGTIIGYCSVAVAECERPSAVVDAFTEEAVNR